jgi:hypothetical protein
MLLTASHVYKISSLLNTRAEVVISVVLLVCIALIEVLQLAVLHYRTTIWARVSLACQRVREQALNKHGGFCMRFKVILTKIGVHMSNEHYFEEKFGQYSLLESVSYHPNPSKYSFLDILNKSVAPINGAERMAFHPLGDHLVSFRYVSSRIEPGYSSSELLTFISVSIHTHLS